MDRRTFIAAAAATLASPLLPGTASARINEKRTAKVLDVDAYCANPNPEDHSVWKHKRFAQIRAGDIFQIVEPDGQVDVRKDETGYWRAVEDPYLVPMNGGEMTWTIKADLFEFPRRQVFSFTDKDGNKTEMDITFNFQFSDMKQDVSSS
jgi:hypothetical protein